MFHLVQAKYPKFSKEQIDNKISELTGEEIDELLSPYYDNKHKHIEVVVKDILDNWKNRSVDGKYNALLTTHVGGNKPSIPRAIAYYEEFKKQNTLLDPKDQIKVAVSFSSDTSNGDNQLENNKALKIIIEDYNKTFGTKISFNNIEDYTENINERLKKKSDDHNYLDLVIVVDQLLTGFDAPELNTLYVDRTLKGANLIQAYSRTNRIENMQNKPYGHIVNYRMKNINERLMNEALAIYSDEKSANLQLQIQNLEESGILAKSFNITLEDTQNIIRELRKLTDDFYEIPKSEKEQERSFNLIKRYNGKISALKQYSHKTDFDETGGGDGDFRGFDYKNPELFYGQLGITEEEDFKLKALTDELKRIIAEEKNIDLADIDLEMTHIKEIKINYDYLEELVKKLAQAKEEENEQELKVLQDRIDNEIKSYTEENPKFIDKVKNAVKNILNGEWKPGKSLNDISGNEIINQASEITINKDIQGFRTRFGIDEIVKNSDLLTLFKDHTIGERDLDKAGKLDELLKSAADIYKKMADEDIRDLSWIKYRNTFREELQKLADQIVSRR